MCVAVVIETKTGPTAMECWQMEDSNPHGAGVAWVMGDLVRYKKGLTWKQAYDLLQKIPRPALLHFRWATHGGRSKHLTHPFPIGPRALTSRKLNGAAKAVLIHNGVWNNYLLHAPEDVDLNKWSDTAVAAYAAGVYGEEILDDVDWSTAVGRASGDGRLDITMRGDWHEHNGNLYSNLTWVPYSQRKTTELGRWSALSDNYGARCDWSYPRITAGHPDGQKRSAFDEWLEEHDAANRAAAERIRQDAITIRPTDDNVIPINAAIEQLALKLGGK